MHAIHALCLMQISTVQGTVHVASTVQLCLRSVQFKKLWPQYHVGIFAFI